MFTTLAKLLKGFMSVITYVLPFTAKKLQRRARYGGEEAAKFLVKGGKAAGDQAGKAAGDAGKVSGEARKAGGGWGQRFFRFLLILLVIAALVGLYFFGRLPWVSKYIEWARDFAPFFPPLVGLLVFGLIWLGWYVLKLLAAEEEQTQYPDIDLAWDEAVWNLEQAGIDVKSAPLFLVLGKPAGTEEALFDSSGQRLNVRKVPSRPAPVHIWAGPEAIFVTCAGASLLGELAEVMAGIKEPVMDGEADGSPSIVLGGGTRLPNANFIQMQRILRSAGGRKLTEDEHRQLAKLCARDEARQGHMLDRAKQSLLKNPQKVAEAGARLRRLCQLIVRDRRPFCSVNGMLFLIPVGGAASDSDASLTGEVCQREYAVAHAALQVDCPIFALVCDVETVQGFRDFRGSFAEEELAGRVGQRYPLVPDLSGDEMATSIDEAIAWVGDATIPGWVYKFFQIEKNANREEAVEIFRKNARLFQFMGTMRERMRRLSRIITRGLLDQKDHQPMFAGCYIAGTGRAESDQAFGAGVFRRLLSEQDNVAWTQEALDREAEYQRLLGIGYIVLVILAIVDVALIGFAIRGRF